MDVPQCITPGSYGGPQGLSPILCLYTQYCVNICVHTSSGTCASVPWINLYKWHHWVTGPIGLILKYERLLQTGSRRCWFPLSLGHSACSLTMLWRPFWRSPELHLHSTAPPSTLLWFGFNPRLSRDVESLKFTPKAGRIFS